MATANTSSSTTRRHTHASLIEKYTNSNDLSFNNIDVKTTLNNYNTSSTTNRNNNTSSYYYDDDSSHSTN